MATWSLKQKKFGNNNHQPSTTRLSQLTRRSLLILTLRASRTTMRSLSLTEASLSLTISFRPPRTEQATRSFSTTTSLMRRASRHRSRLTSWRTTWMRTTIIYPTFAMVSVESCFAISSTLTSSSQSLTGRRQKKSYQCYWMMLSVCSRMATALCGLTTTTTLSTRPRISFRAIGWSFSSGTRKR